MMERNKENTSPESEYFECHICKKTFKNKRGLTQHMHMHNRKRECESCGASFSFPNNLKRHKQEVHGLQTNKKGTHTAEKCNSSVALDQNGSDKISFSCRHCQNQFSTYRQLVNHIEKNHILKQRGGRQETNSKHLFNNEMEKSENIIPSSSSKNEPTQENNDSHHSESDEDSGGLRNDTVTENSNVHQSVSESALRNQVNNRFIYPRRNERYDMLPFLANSRDEIMTYLKARARQLGGIKWNLCVQVEMQRDDGHESTISTPYFRSLTYRLLQLEELTDHDLNEAFQKIFAGLEKYQKEGSNWFVKSILKLEIHTVVYQPLSGSTYIPLPKTLVCSKSILNIQNIDNKCFLYCVLASMHPQQCMQPEDPRIYEPYEHELVMKGIQYPVAINDILKFERKNDNISINVFGFENDTIIPLRVTNHTDRLHHVNLLWLKNEHTSHYCLITDLNRFLSRTKNVKNKTHFCPYCLHGFTREDLLLHHKDYCSPHGPQKVILPSSDKDVILKFKDYGKTLKIPFVIYADFETVNLPIHTCTPNPECASTTPTTKLIVSGFAYKRICEQNRFTRPTVVYRGPNAAEKLIEALLEEQKDIRNILSHIEPIPDHEGLIDNAKHCCLCKREFTLYDRTYKKIVCHHNHLTGEIIGAACSDCNLNCKQSKFTCVIFHNLRNFDAHILCESLGKFKDYRLTCIPQTSERYVSFSLGDLRFLDSFQFMQSGLETLVDNLKQEGVNAFPHLCSEFKADEIDLLTKKGIYPYDYMDSFDRFEEKELPPITKFYSFIKKSGISTDDYLHAKRVFNKFNMSCLGEYHDLYVKTDVLLLADVFESFRKVCLSQYELDPCHFYTSPGLSWASLLKMTDVELELLTDIDKILMFERSTRGGLSQVANRYKKCNNPLLKDYDPSVPTSYLMYLDANNLYGWAMVQPLPVGDFKFLENVENFDVMNIEENGDIGCIIDVSLHYPPELHDSHNCLPLAPEKMFITNEQLSPYAQELLRKIYGLKTEDPLPARGQVKKLLATLGDKDHYILHYRNLQLYVKLGLKIKQIHRVLQFKQKPWMKPYIDFNTEMRKRAKSTFEKNFYKLMNCSVFGKTLQNERKHRNIELVHLEKRLKKLTAKPTYKNTTIFNEDLVAVELLQSKVKLFKPSYCGMCILDLSKWLMYDFWYGYVKQTYGERAQLQMTDTDSLLFYCETDNIYEDMMLSKHLFDTSEYPKDHILCSNHNKKVLGKMKDESNGQPISEFVGLRSKMYSYTCKNKEEKSDECTSEVKNYLKEEKRAKGVSKVTVEKDLKHAHYKSVLFNEKKLVSSMASIRSHRHELFCENINKTGLSAFDDKRFLINSVESYAYSHYKINEAGEMNENALIPNETHLEDSMQSSTIQNTTQMKPSIIKERLYTAPKNKSFTLNCCKITPINTRNAYNQHENFPTEYTESIHQNQFESLVFEDRMYTRLENESSNLNGCQIIPIKSSNEGNKIDAVGEITELTIIDPPVPIAEHLIFEHMGRTPLENQSFVLSDFEITPCN